MYHLLIIHLPDEGHLGCFHSLVIVSKVAVNIAEQDSVEEMKNPLDISQGVE